MLRAIRRESHYADEWRRKAPEIHEHVKRKIERKEPVAENVHAVAHDQLTFGQRISDGLAQTAGSWTFIFSFAGVLLIWILLNSVALVHHWDVYPYILLNLMLSMLAAIQAPVIMMSQNRQEARDRIRGENDYAVNLKAELEIQRLHEKVDELRERQWVELIDIQNQQIEMLKAQLAILTAKSEPVSEGHGSA